MTTPAYLAFSVPKTSLSIYQQLARKHGDSLNARRTKVRRCVRIWALIRCTGAGVRGRVSELYFPGRVKPHIRMPLQCQFQVDARGRNVNQFTSLIDGEIVIRFLAKFL